MATKHKETINEMTRDFCSVIPLPKSEVRRRLRNLQQQERERILEKIMEIKYRSHDPLKGCPCEVCRIANELTKFIKEE